MTILKKEALSIWKKFGVYFPVILATCVLCAWNGGWHAEGTEAHAANETEVHAAEEAEVQAAEESENDTVWMEKAPHTIGFDLRVNRGDTVSAEDLAEAVLGADHGLQHLAMREEIRLGRKADIHPSEYESYTFDSVGDRIILVYGEDGEGDIWCLEAKIAVDLPETEKTYGPQYDRIQSFSDEDGVIYTMTDRLTGSRITHILYPDGSWSDIQMMANGSYLTRYCGADGTSRFYRKAAFTEVYLRGERSTEQEAAMVSERKVRNGRLLFVAHRNAETGSQGTERKPVSEETENEAEVETNIPETEISKPEQILPEPTEEETEAEIQPTEHEHSWEEVFETVHHEAEYTSLHHDAVYETVHHDAEYDTVVHDAEYTTVHHEAEYEMVHHDAEYTTVYHEAVYDTIYHEAEGHYSYHVMHSFCNKCGLDLTEYGASSGYGTSAYMIHAEEAHDFASGYTMRYAEVSKEEYDQAVSQEGSAWELDADNYLCKWKEWEEDTEAWEEPVLVHDAWEETVLVQDAWDEEVLTQEAWDEEILVQDAWEETFLVQDAWDEDVLVQDAWDEDVLVQDAWDERISVGERCRECGAER